MHRRKTVMIVVFSFIFFVLVVGSVFFFFFPRTSSLGSDGDIISLFIGSHVFNAELAVSSAALSRGLSGRESLSSKTGMLFVFSRSARHTFWMQGMLFDLDFIWIDDGRVVDIAENVPAPGDSLMPTIVRSDQKARWVFELPAGSIEKYGIKRGDEVKTEK